MLSGSKVQDIPFDMGDGRRKTGVYEREGSVLARRVELPSWLYESFQRHGKAVFVDDMRSPRFEIGESRGHVFISPPSSLSRGPMVGVDFEIFGLLVKDQSLKVIEFHVYGMGYRLVDVWQIDAEAFLNDCRQVQGKVSFMPQAMIEVSRLRERRPLCKKYQLPA